MQSKITAFVLTQTQLPQNTQLFRQAKQEISESSPVMFFITSLMLKAKWYVYELIDPLTEKVFYVGKGSGDRIDAHEKEAKRGVCSKKCNKINSINALGKEIIKRKIALFWCEQAAYDCETDLISHYGLKNLTNISPGGQKSFERKILEKNIKKPVDIIKILSNNIHIVKHWYKLTDGGKYKVRAVLTGDIIQDTISKMVAVFYNECIEKIIIDAVRKAERV